MKILVVEDDPVIGHALRRGIEEGGHECVWAQDGCQGLQEALSMQFDAVVLDLMLPGTSGLEVLASLRAHGSRTPVIVVTARGAVQDRVAGLKAGADDYMAKPFAMVELLARLETVSRRVADRPPLTLQLGDLALDLSARRIQRNKVHIELTPTESSILEMLMRQPNKIVTRKMIGEKLWDSDWSGTTNVVEVHINRLRGKLSRCGCDFNIETARGRGYLLPSPADQKR
jgi:two-component system OmpR family response regulator/two-component system copper resistance phosphate regulon response regulator CusR